MFSGVIWIKNTVVWNCYKEILILWQIRGTQAVRSAIIMAPEYPSRFNC